MYTSAWECGTTHPDTYILTPVPSCFVSSHSCTHLELSWNQLFSYTKEERYGHTYVTPHACA